MTEDECDFCANDLCFECGECPDCGGCWCWEEDDEMDYVDQD